MAVGCGCVVLKLFFVVLTVLFEQRCKATGHGAAVGSAVWPCCMGACVGEGAAKLCQNMAAAAVWLVMARATHVRAAVAISAVVCGLLGLAVLLPAAAFSSLFWCCRGAYL